MIYAPKDKKQIEKFLSDGISEAQESDEYTISMKDGLTKGLGDDERKSQLKNLQGGTEKILKALWLSINKEINKRDKKGILNNKTLSLGDFINELSKGDTEITSEEILILKKINNANELKHGISYQTNEIEGVRSLLNKLDRITRENLKQIK